MARRKGNKGLLLAGLAAGAYAYFKKPENREKATIAFNNAKLKVNSYMESQNLESQNRENSQKEDGKTETTTMRESKMTSEGGLAGAQYYNEQAQADYNEQDDLKLSSNDVSKDKAENTKAVASETRLNTDNL